MARMDPEAKPRDLELFDRLWQSAEKVKDTVKSQYKFEDYEIDDVMQMTGEKLFLKANTLRNEEPKSINLFAKTTLYNAAKDYLRARRRYRKRHAIGLPEEVAEIVDLKQSEADRCQYEHRHLRRLEDQLQAIINELNNEGQTLLLSRFNGTIKDVAQQLNRKPATTQSDRFRLERRLANQLGIEREAFIRLLAHMKISGLLDDLDSDSESKPKQPR